MKYMKPLTLSKFEPLKFGLLTFRLLTFGLMFVSCNSSTINSGNGGGSGTDLSLNSTLKTNELDSSDKQALLDAINAKRAKGFTCPTGGGRAMPAVPAFTWNDKLELAALRHTNVMLVKSPEFNKVNPHSGLGDGNPGTRANAVGYKWLVIGENIAGGAPDVSEVIKDWLESTDGHCEAIMDKDFTQIGASKLSTTGGPYATYWTLDFGKPQ